MNSAEMPTFPISSPHSNSETCQLCKGSQRNAVNQFFSGSDDQMSVICVEMLVTGAIIERNLPVAFADQFGQLLLDSKIAQKFSCAYTKATSCRLHG